MDFSKFIANNWEIIKSAPAIFITFFFLVSGVMWFIINFLYKNQIETLKERISLKDEQTKYYKELSEVRQEPSEHLKESEISLKENVIPPSANNLKDNIFREINYLEQHAGKSLSVQLFSRLQPKYDFTVILSEILLMNRNNELEWDNAPNPPDALSEIIIVKQKNNITPLTKKFNGWKKPRR
jgi:hypothetical protein